MCNGYRVMFAVYFIGSQDNINPMVSCLIIWYDGLGIILFTGRNAIIYQLSYYNESLVCRKDCLLTNTSFLSPYHLQSVDCPSAWPGSIHFLHQRIHYDDIIMSAIASQITSLTIVYSIVYSDADQGKHQSSPSLAFVWGLHRGPVNSPHKWPVTRKMFPFDDVIMFYVIEVTHLAGTATDNRNKW